MTDQKVPDGAIAEQILDAKEEVGKDPTMLPKDPNYVEPTTLVKFQETADAINREADTIETWEQANKVFLQQKVLIGMLLTRCERLETAAIPFAINALMFSNARMCLIVNGRPTEPAGGTWISTPPQGIRMTANEGIFFDICDAVGRERVQKLMEDNFTKIQDANKLEAERDKHVEDGGTVH